MKTSPNCRIISLAKEFQVPLEKELKLRGYDVSQPERLALAVKKMSDYYLENDLAKTPWHEVWAQAAQLCYFFPLNYARNKAVALEASRLGFFKDLTAISDFGSGAGAGLYAFLEQIRCQPELNQNFSKIRSFDISQEALDLGIKIAPPSWPIHEVSLSNKKISCESKKELLIASYVFTELKELPAQWLDFEALAIIEPSTQADSRRLMELRQTLIHSGYQIWAPCTHFDNCPLLKHSEKDWCHDRIYWQAPKWFLDVENFLPIKNRTVTFSYLLARKTLGPPHSLKQLSRLTGDMLIEKGKTRQSLCRSSNREFLSWFPQRLEKGDSIELQRGSLVKLPADLEEKSNEVRLKSSRQITELESSETII